MSIHVAILNVLVSLGYTRTPGCCHGFSLKWLEACILGEEHLFHERINKIVTVGASFVQRIHAAKEKKGEKLTAHDIESLDILAFYDSLELYQSPSVHYSLFNTPLMQDDIDIISNIASSDAIQSRGGLVRIYSEPGIYTKKEIKAYFDRLGVLIENTCAQLNEPVGIVLSSNNHTIALTYTSGQGWKFMDINQYPSKSFMINNTQLLAERIMRGFMQSSSPYRAFNVSLLTTGNHLGLVQLKETLAPFKKSHRLTKEIASREVAEGIGLARIAAQQGYSSVIAEMATYAVDLNKADKEGTTLAYVAAQKGHASVIVELAKYGVNLNQGIKTGATPAYIAAQEGHASVIAELAKHGVDLDKPNSNGVTPAFIAVHNGHALVIAELAKHKVNLNQVIGNGATLVHIAAQKGYASVIAELAKCGVDLNQADNDGVTPAYIAAQNGHASVIAELAKHKVDLNQVDNDGITLTYIAAQNGHASVIAELAMHEVDLNPVIGNGITLALIAAKQGHALVIAELAKHKVELNQAMSDGATPAFIAAQEGHVVVIAELIKAGVNVDTPYISSADNLRQFAITRGEKVIKRMNDFIDQQLVQSPTRHTFSMTPYHIAVVMGHREIMDLLNKTVSQDQNEQLNDSRQHMEQTKRSHYKTIGDGNTFYSLEKKVVSSSEVNDHPSSKFSNAY